MNHIIPVFVFDGKPPPEKYDMLTKRKSEKKTAEEKTLEIQNKIDNLLSKDIYADTSQLKNWVGYKSLTSIEKGIEKFADWYKDYYLIK